MKSTIEPEERLIKKIKPVAVGDFPLKYYYDNSRTEVFEWLSQNKGIIRKELLEYGAILFRGFPFNTVEEFNKAYKIICGDPIEYKFRTSPREEVSSKIYTSTSHPPDQVIHMHTENSYSGIWNSLIAFYCSIPPGTGGETPIADERKLISIVKKDYIEKFRKKGIMYVRNTLPGIGLDWKTIYQTSDKAVVEGFLKKNQMNYEWVSEDHLRTSWILPAFRKHPVSGELLWFNHMFFGHKTLYDPMVLDFIGEENLPFSTFYGDGEPIEDEVINDFKKAYEQCKIEFNWEKGDLLVLENMMYSHGRNPFEGERKILVAMSEIVEP